jgi:predicted enzyme related to lactoylglutathione lyase
MLTGAAAVFTVQDLPQSLAHYRDALGFDVTFEYGEPSYYACLCRDDVQLHLIAAAQSQFPPGQGKLCIFVTDVDTIHAELVKRGARVKTAPQTWPYGMRDFDVVDLDGNQLIFGMGIEKQ